MRSERDEYDVINEPIAGDVVYAGPNCCYRREVVRRDGGYIWYDGRKARNMKCHILFWRRSCTERCRVHHIAESPHA